jgi:hypothetical protein
MLKPSQQKERLASCDVSAAAIRAEKISSASRILAKNRKNLDDPKGRRQVYGV